MVQRFNGSAGLKVQHVQQVQRFNGLMVQWFKVILDQWFNRFKGSMVQLFIKVSKIEIRI